MVPQEGSTAFHLLMASFLRLMRTMAWTSKLELCGQSPTNSVTTLAWKRMMKRSLNYGDLSSRRDWSLRNLMRNAAKSLEEGQYYLSTHASKRQDLMGRSSAELF